MMEAMERVIWNPNMNGGEWEVFGEDMITYRTATHMEVMQLHVENELGIDPMSKEEILGIMDKVALEWSCLEGNLDREDVANHIMGIQEGYRCEQEDVPAGILAWAMMHETGDR